MENHDFFLMGKSTIFMAIFSIALFLFYQRDPEGTSSFLLATKTAYESSNAFKTAIELP